MRITLEIDDELLQKAMRLTGIDEKDAVVSAGLKTLMAREAARRLAALGGSLQKARPLPRRRVHRPTRQRRSLA